MSLLPKNVDVYLNQEDIFKPISEILLKCVRRINKHITPKLLSTIDIELKKAYKHAPTNLRSMIPDLHKKTSKLQKLMEKLSAENDKKKIKKIENTIYEIFPEYVSDLGLIAKELADLAAKESGDFYINFPEKYNITVGDYDHTGNRVEYVRNPVVVTVNRPLDKMQMESKCKPKQLETFMYLLEEAQLIGFKAKDIPVKLTEQKLRSILYKLTGKQVNLPMFRLKHATSKRIWFLVDELGITYKAVQFADRQLADESTLVRDILAETDMSKMIISLIHHGFSVTDSAQIATRLYNVEDLATKHHILTMEINNLKRILKTKRLKEQREAFKISQQDNYKTLSLLEDDYQKSREDKQTLDTKFQILTSQDGEPETGLKESQYNKLDILFDSTARQQTRNVKDMQERINLRKRLKQTRIEARELHYQILEGKQDNKKRLIAIKVLNERINKNRLKLLEDAGGNNDYNRRIKNAT